MDIKEIKNLLRNSTAVLVMDNSEPSFVVMNYQAYKDLVPAEDSTEIKVKNIDSVGDGVPKQVQREGELEILERINKEILALKDEIEKEEKSLYLTPNIDPVRSSLAEVPKGTHAAGGMSETLYGID